MTTQIMFALSLTQTHKTSVD